MSTSDAPAKPVHRCDFSCKYFGVDPDGAYCVHPNVLVEWQYGLALTSQKIVKFCPAPEHPLFEFDEERSKWVEEQLKERGGRK